MNINEALWIDRVHAPSAPGSAAGTGNADGSQFARLLEQLKELSDRNRTVGAEPVTTGGSAVEGASEAEDFRRQMRAADDAFVAAMDLRRQLEDAYRRHQP